MNQHLVGIIYLIKLLRLIVPSYLHLHKLCNKKKATTYVESSFKNNIINIIDVK